MFKLLIHIGICLIGSGWALLASGASAQQISSAQQGIVTLLSEQFSQSEGLSASLQASDNGVLFVLSNSGPEAINVLRWETPLEAELTQDVFQVTPAIAGNLDVLAGPAPYSGRLIKRGAPQADDFIQIQSGESVSAVVPIAEYYQLAEDGLYSVAFTGAFNIQSIDENESVLSLETTSLLKTVTTESVAVRLVSAPEVLFASVGGYNSCSIDQQAEIALDLDASELIVREARQALEELPENERAGSPRYLHWFGQYDETRYNTVLETYRKAEQVMANGSIEFNCSCTESHVAHIFPLDPFKVYLCNTYWLLQRTGSDSKAGSLLHELSHFPEVGDTDDLVYGSTASAELADSQPNRAVINADNIEYFAENTPFRELYGAAIVPIQFTTLQLGSEVGENIATGDFAYFQVTGADYVELLSFGGDADIVIYSSELLDNEICSEDTIDIDRCELDGSSTAYIKVVGYVGTYYTINAGTNAPPAPPASESLALDQAQVRSISSGENQYFRADGATVLEIQSLTGGATAKLHTNESRSADALLCTVQSSSNESSIGSCGFTESTVYVTVIGDMDGQYQITAKEGTIVQPETVPLDPVPEETAPLDPVPEETAPLDPVPEETAPLDPVPEEPVPLDPVPEEPVPLDPVPEETAPLDPVPEETAPLDPVPEETAPLDPVPEETAPLDPVPEEPAPLDPVPEETAPLDPVPEESAPLDPVPEETTPLDPVPEQFVPVDPVAADDPITIDSPPVTPGPIDTSDTDTGTDSGGSSGGGQFGIWFGLSLVALLLRRRRVTRKPSGTVL